MDARDLTMQEYSQLSQSLQRCRAYLDRLQMRMAERSWRRDDPALASVLSAYHAVNAAVQAMAQSRKIPAISPFRGVGSGDEADRIP